MEPGTKRSIVLWSSIAAAATGILAVAAVYKWRSRLLSAHSISTRIRDVQDVLLDCESKLHEIKGHISEILPAMQQH